MPGPIGEYLRIHSDFRLDLLFKSMKNEYERRWRKAVKDFLTGA
jgi:hypothetical protein